MLTALLMTKQEQKAKSNSRTERNINFLRYAADEHRGTLNAGIAVARLEILLDDIQRLSALTALAPEPETHAESLPPEIVSYYAVGFTTCLEWHARSRLSDLFTYRPSIITDEDLNQGGGTKVIAHLIRENASISQYLAAIPNYSTPEAYIGAFVRVFDALSIGTSPRDILHKNHQAKTLGYESGRSCLAALYDFRNILVHEITRSQAGHPIIRDVWTCKEARGFGEFVLFLMSEIEGFITRSAPANFPNRLVLGSASENLESLLDREIETLENELSSKIEGFSELCFTSLSARQKEEQVLQDCLPHLRWYDTKAAPRCALRRGRLAYLQALKKELEDTQELSEFSKPNI
jgi:hypothetical protein